MAVSGTFLITTVLFLAMARWRWHWPTWKLATGAAIFVPIEGTFLAANLSKVHHGGWLSLVIAGGLYLLMTTWHRGSQIVDVNHTRQAGPLREFVAELHAMNPPPPPGPRHRGLPQPVRGDDATRAAGERRAQPRAA